MNNLFENENEKELDDKTTPTPTNETPTKDESNPFAKHEIDESIFADDVNEEEAVQEETPKIEELNPFATPEVETPEVVEVKVEEPNPFAKPEVETPEVNEEPNPFAKPEVEPIEVVEVKVEEPNLFAKPEVETPEVVEVKVEEPNPFAKPEVETHEVNEEPNPFAKPEVEPIEVKEESATSLFAASAPSKKPSKKKGLFKKAPKGEKVIKAKIEWKSILAFWKKDDNSLNLKDIKEKKAATDRVISLALITTVSMALSMIILGFLLAYVSASVEGTFLESDLAKAFNWVSVSALLGVPLFLTYFLYDLFSSSRARGYKNFTKNELKRIFISAGLAISAYTIIFGSLLDTTSWMLQWITAEDDAGLEITGGLRFAAYTSVTFMWINFAITLFMGLLVVWLVRYSKLNKVAIFAGSFDPIHDGHVNIIEKGTKIFDRIFVVVATNSLKESKPLEDRYTDVKAKLINTKRVKVVKLESGLLADYAMEKDIQFLIRSARNDFDFEYEVKMAESNKMRYEDLETVLIMPDEKYKNLSSTSIRENTKHEDIKETMENPFAVAEGEVKVVEKEDAEKHWFSEKIA